MFSNLTPESNQRPGNDPIFALSEEARSKIANGERVIDATLGCLFDDRGQLLVVNAWDQVAAEIHPSMVAGYAPISGVQKFNHAIIEDTFSDFQHLKQISVSSATPGGTGAVTSSIVNFLEPGETLVSPHLYWGPYSTISSLNGRRLLTYQTFTPDLNFNLEGLEQAVHKTSKENKRVLTVINSPCNNPTGYSLSPSEWDGVGDILSNASNTARNSLIIDLAYFKFGPKNNHWLSVVEKICDDVQVLIAWSGSKSFTRYGARVGGIIALNRDAGSREKLKRAFSYSSRGTWSNCNHMGQFIATKLITDDRYKKQVNIERNAIIDLLQDRVDVFNVQAQKYNLVYPRYEGGFFVTVFCKDPQDVAKRMRDKNVYLIPVKDGVRVGLCSVASKDIPELVEVLNNSL
ncbi:hypothetical protein CL659_01005 [bacterium]|nr:hypothetical protein [bacterium]|tara:strand:- start:20514 stop:21725 length:1212 start_codon:yes stop_codon:yes gene_type:complete